MFKPARSHETPSAVVLSLSLSLSIMIGAVPSPTFAAQPPAPRLEGRMMMVEPEPEVADPRVSLRVDTDALGGADEPMKAKIVEIATGVFRNQGFVDAIDDQDPVIVVVVERTGDVENPGFVMGYSIEQGDEIVPGSARQSDCSLCTRTEVIERIEKDLEPLLELAREHQVEREGVEVGGDGDGDGDVGPVGDDRKIGPLGFAGIGLAVVGLAGVGAGVGLAVKGVEPTPPYQKSKDFRTPGNVILAIGGAALIAGVVMIAVDVSKRKKSRSQKAAKIRAFGPGFAF
jgi:hypothetical protein